MKNINLPFLIADMNKEIDFLKDKLADETKVEVRCYIRGQIKSLTSTIKDIEKRIQRGY